MADVTNNIDIAVTDSVSPEIAPKLIRIADASDKANQSLGSLKAQLSSLNTGSLSSQLSSVESSSLAATTAQGSLSAAMRQTASGSLGATSALYALRGSMMGTTRAAGGLLASLINLGPVLPLIGAVALTEIVFQLGESLFKTIKTAEDAGHKIAEAFDEAISSLRKTDDELAMTNDRLDVTIARLQGRPSSNGIQLALDEARLSADKLDDSLERVQRSLEQVLGKYSISLWQSILTGQASTGPTSDFVRQQFDQLNDVRQKATEAIDAATSLRDPKASHEALMQAYSQERAAIQSVVSALQTEYNARKAIQDAPQTIYAATYGAANLPREDQTANLTMLGKAAHLAQEEMRGLDLAMQNIGKNEVVDKLRDHTSELKNQIKEAAAQWKQLESAFVAFQSEMDRSGHRATPQQSLAELEQLGQNINPLNADKLAAKELPFRNAIANNSWKDEESQRLQDQVNEIGLYSNALKEAAALNGILEQARRRNIDLSPEEIAGYKSQIAEIVESRQYTEELSRIFEQTSGAALKFSATLDALHTLYGRGQLSEETYAQGIFQTMKQYNEAASAVQKFTNAIIIQSQEESNHLGTQRQIAVKNTLQSLDERLRQPGADASHPFGYSQDEIAKVNDELAPLIQKIQDRNAVEGETNKLLNQQSDLLDQLATKEAARQAAIKQGALSATAGRSGALNDWQTQNDQKLSSGIGGNPYSGAIAQYAAQFTTLAKGIEDAFTPVFKTLSDGFADSLGRAIADGQKLGDALKTVAREGIAEIISGLVKLGIQEAINLTLGAAMGSAATAASAAQGAALAAAWAPAAFAASVASFGTADSIGLSAYTSGLAVAQALTSIPRFDVGTNFVPSDMIAQVHAGERIIPAADNIALIDAVRNQNARSTQPSIEIHNHGTTVEVQHFDENRVRLIVHRETPGIIQQHAPKVIATDIANPNSQTSKAIARNTTATRNR